MSELYIRDRLIGLDIFVRSFYFSKLPYLRSYISEITNLCGDEGVTLGSFFLLEDIQM